MKKKLSLPSKKNYHCQVNGTKHKFFVYSAFYDDRYIPQNHKLKNYQNSIQSISYLQWSFFSLSVCEHIFVNITDSSYSTILDHQNSCPPPLSPSVSLKENRKKTLVNLRVSALVKLREHVNVNLRVNISVNLRIYAIVNITLISSSSSERSRWSDW